MRVSTILFSLFATMSLGAHGCGSATTTTDAETTGVAPSTEGTDPGTEATDTPIASEGPLAKAPLAKSPASDRDTPPTDEELACATDADCVPGTCCHPKVCVNEGARPDCKGMMCTMDCRGGTMDCGAGRCVCRDGKCAVHMNAPRVPGAMTPSAGPE